LNKNITRDKGLRVPKDRRHSLQTIFVSDAKSSIKHHFAAEHREFLQNETKRWLPLLCNIDLHIKQMTNAWQ